MPNEPVDSQQDSNIRDRVIILETRMTHLVSRVDDHNVMTTRHTHEIRESIRTLIAKLDISERELGIKTDKRYELLEARIRTQEQFRWMWLGAFIVLQFAFHFLLKK